MVHQIEISSSSFYWPKILILISLLKKVYLLCAYTVIALEENTYLFNISDFKVQIEEISYYQWISLTFVFVGDTDLLLTSFPLYMGHNFSSCSHCLLPAVNDVPSWKSVAEWSFNSF